MKKDDLIKNTNRLHVLRLFDMIADSEYDTFEMIRRHSRVKTRGMADVYIYALYELDMTFVQAVSAADPEWLYNHFSPLHEVSLSNCWDKIERIKK